MIFRLFHYKLIGGSTFFRNGALRLKSKKTILLRESSACWEWTYLIEPNWQADTIGQHLTTAATRKSNTLVQVKQFKLQPKWTLMRWIEPWFGLFAPISTRPFSLPRRFLERDNSFVHSRVLFEVSCHVINLKRQFFHFQNGRKLPRGIFGLILVKSQKFLY